MNETRLSVAREQALPETASPAQLGEAAQRRGKRLIYAGFAITILGVVLYCLVCFAGGMNVELGDVLLQNSVPFTRVTLVILGLGTLSWLVGTFSYLRAVMDMDERAAK